MKTLEECKDEVAKIHWGSDAKWDDYYSLRITYEQAAELYAQSIRDHYEAKLKERKETIESLVDRLNGLEADYALLMNEKKEKDAEIERQWIDVNDNNPPIHEKILFVGKEGRIYFGRRNGNNSFYYSYDKDSHIYGVTHWMPLPEPPEK